MKHTKEELLGKIARCDAMQAQWGSKSSKLCNEYAKKYSEFKQGNRVKIINTWGEEKYGEVDGVFFNFSHYMYYSVQLWKKDFSRPMNGRDHIWVGKNRTYNIIKKAK